MKKGQRDFSKKTVDLNTALSYYNNISNRKDIHMRKDQAAVLIQIMRKLEAEVGTLNDVGLDDYADMLQDIGYKIVEELTEKFKEDDLDTLFGYYGVE